MKGCESLIIKECVGFNKGSPELSKILDMLKLFWNNVTSLKHWRFILEMKDETSEHPHYYFDIFSDESMSNNSDAIKKMNTLKNHRYIVHTKDLRDSAPKSDESYVYGGINIPYTLSDYIDEKIVSYGMLRVAFAGAENEVIDLLVAMDVMEVFIQEVYEVFDNVLFLDFKLDRLNQDIISSSLLKKSRI